MAHLGIGIGKGQKAMADAAQNAISSPMLETSIDGARAVLINVTCNSNCSIVDINDAVEMITAAADSEANIIFGASIDDALEDEVHITVIATGFERCRSAAREQHRPPGHAALSGAPTCRRATRRAISRRPCRAGCREAAIPALTELSAGDGRLRRPQQGAMPGERRCPRSSTRAWPVSACRPTRRCPICRCRASRRPRRSSMKIAARRAPLWTGFRRTCVASKPFRPAFGSAFCLLSL